MDLSWFPSRFFRPRGWGLIGAGIFALILAQFMGRRDLLLLGSFLILLPLMAVLVLRLAKPDFSVYREFSPSLVETHSTTTVNLAVGTTRRLSGRVTMTEALPPRFGEPPSFGFPSRSATSWELSRYQYHLRSAKRGQFRIGPVAAEFSDPFGLSLRRHQLNGTDLLTVTPAAVELPVTGLAGARGIDGIIPTRQRANPSDDDVMTREYRYGDPMRRVHWPATARHGQLMVRQEESVTTPEATLILDSRLAAYPHVLNQHSGNGTHPELATTENFEWAVIAAMSIAAHLVERNFSLRALDPFGRPAFRGSSSAPHPDTAQYGGSTGLAAIAESLAAIELTDGQEPPASGTRAGRVPTAPATDPRDANRAAAFSEVLLDELAAHRQRGPLIAVLGNLSRAQARTLAPAAEHGAGALALVVCDRPQDEGPVLEALRMGGWRAIAVNHRTSLPAAWSYFDDAALLSAASGTTALDGRRAPGTTDRP